MREINALLTSSNSASAKFPITPATMFVTFPMGAFFFTSAGLGSTAGDGVSTGAGAGELKLYVRIISAFRVYVGLVVTSAALAFTLAFLLIFVLVPVLFSLKPTLPNPWLSSESLSSNTLPAGVLEEEVTSFSTH